MLAKAYATALCCCVCMGVYAQDVEHDAITIEDNATKRNLLTSKSVESVDNEFIMGNLGGSLSESLEKIPGLSSITIGSSQGKPVVRGLGFQRVAVIEDNIRHESQQWGSDHGLEVDQYSVLEAEVIKGPASLEYGSDAVGGVLRLNTHNIPKKHTLKGCVNMTAKSSNGFFGGSADVEGRREKFFFSVRATAQDYADYKVPTDYISIYSYRVKLKDHRLRNTAGSERDFAVSAGVVGNNYKLRASVSDVNSEGGMFANAHGLEPRRVNEAAHDRNIRDILSPSYSVNHLKTALQFDRWAASATFSINAAYQHNRREEQSEYVSHGYMPTHCPETLQNPDTEYLYDKDVLSLNAVATVPVKEILLKSGISGEYQRNEIGGRCFIIPGFMSMTAGGFTSAEYRISGGTVLQAGVRYDVGNIKTDRYLDWFATEGEYVTRAEDLDRNFGDFTFGCGVSTRHGKMNYKFNLAKGFRMPIAKELAANGVNYHNFSYEIGDPNLKSETSYQADFQIDYLSRMFTVSMSPFVGYFGNYIFLNPTPRFDRLYGNGNQIYNYTQCRVLRYGGEVEARFVADNRFAPFHHTKIEVALSGEFVKSRQLDGEKEGYSLPFAPPATIGMETVFTYRLKGDKDKPRKCVFQELYIGIDAKKAAKVTDIVPPENPTDGYFLAELSAGCSAMVFGKDVSLSSRVRNLLDAVYYDHTSYYRLINVPGQGRCLTISLTIKF